MNISPVGMSAYFHRLSGTRLRPQNDLSQRCKSKRHEKDQSNFEENPLHGIFVLRGVPDFADGVGRALGVPIPASWIGPGGNVTHQLLPTRMSEAKDGPFDHRNSRRLERPSYIEVISATTRHSRRANVRLPPIADMALR